MFCKAKSIEDYTLEGSDGEISEVEEFYYEAELHRHYNRRDIGPINNIAGHYAHDQVRSDLNFYPQ